MFTACGIKHGRCCRPAASSVHYTTSCKHSLVLPRMDEIIARNRLCCLKLLINRYCCIYLVIYIIVSGMHGHKISHLPIRYLLPLLRAHPILHVSRIRVNVLNIPFKCYLMPTVCIVSVIGHRVVDSACK